MPTATRDSAMKKFSNVQKVCFKKLLLATIISVGQVAWATDDSIVRIASGEYLGTTNYSLLAASYFKISPKVIRGEFEGEIVGILHYIQPDSVTVPDTALIVCTEYSGDGLYKAPSYEYDRAVFDSTRENYEYLKQASNEELTTTDPQMRLDSEAAIGLAIADFDGRRGKDSTRFNWSAKRYNMGWVVKAALSPTNEFVTLHSGHVYRVGDDGAIKQAH